MGYERLNLQFIAATKAGYRCAQSLALDAKVIIYWYDHGSDLLILKSIAITENLWILVKNETKL